MEKWIIYKENEFNDEVYDINLNFSEENGLVVVFKSIQKEYNFHFGFINAFRVLDESVVLKEIYKKESIEMFKKTKYRDIIYQVFDGEFSKEIVEMACGAVEKDRQKHYVIMTENYCIDIVSDWEPDITVDYL